jgi:hypothetical protein
MICHVCAKLEHYDQCLVSTSGRSFGKDMLHHDSYSSLEQSATEGCFICVRILAEVEKQLLEEPSSENWLWNYLFPRDKWKGRFTTRVMIIVNSLNIRFEDCVTECLEPEKRADSRYLFLGLRLMDPGRESCSDILL